MEDTFSLLYSLAPPLPPLALLLSFLSPSLPRHPPALLLPSQAVLVRQLGLGTTGKVDGGFVLLIAVDVLEVYHHVQGIG